MMALLLRCTTKAAPLTHQFPAQVVVPPIAALFCKWSFFMAVAKPPIAYGGPDMESR